MPLTLYEKKLVSKTGDPETCEDAIYIGGDFAAVIDGSTSKSSRSWNGLSGGRHAARLILTALDMLSAECEMSEAADFLSREIHRSYKAFQVDQRLLSTPVERATATMALLSAARREIWLFGDCQAMVDGRLLDNHKRPESIVAAARALYLELEQLHGKEIQELAKQDAGRAFIMPLLTRQTILQNHPSSPYAYPVIDGFPVRTDLVSVHPLPAVSCDIVLATDGYPHLHPTLQKSEAALRELLLGDPLLYREFQATKGVSPGCVSFDDRAYIRLKLT